MASKIKVLWLQVGRKNRLWRESKNYLNLKNSGEKGAMNKLLSLIQDENGQLSMMRMMALLFVLSYIVEQQKYVWLGGAAPDLQSLILALGSIGFKIIQKPFEKKA